MRKRDRPPQPAVPIRHQLQEWVKVVDSRPSDALRAFDDPVPGSTDYWMGRYFGPEPSEAADFVDCVMGALVRAAHQPNDATRRALAHACIHDDIVLYVNEIIQRITTQEALSRERIRPLARWLLHNARHPDPVKLGLILIACSGTDEDIDDVMLFGRSDVLAFYAGFALLGLVNDPVDLLWKMARNLTWPGRLPVLEFLSCDIDIDDRPDVQDWLLRHAWSHGDARLDEPPDIRFVQEGALVCAQGGKLLEAISADEIDDELLNSACTLVMALLYASPDDDIEEYEDAVPAVRELLRHLASSVLSLHRLEAVLAIRDWLEWPKPGPFIDPDSDDVGFPLEDDGAELKWPRRAAQRWTDDMRATVDRECRSVLARPKASRLVTRAFHRGDEWERYRALIIAPDVGVDLWDLGFASLEQEPINLHYYGALLRTERHDRIASVLQTAEEHVLPHLGPEPQDQHGRILQCTAECCLLKILGAMHRKSVFSVPLVRAGLNARFRSCREMAVRSLLYHHPSQWLTALEPVLRRALLDEPAPDLRTKVRALLLLTHKYATRLTVTRSGP